MKLLTTEQFKTHFKIQNNSLILSPHVAMIADLCGYSNFSYGSSNNLPELDIKYDSVLIDIEDGKSFPKSKVNHEFAWLKHSLLYLKENGVLYAKVPSHLCVKLSEITNINVKKIFIEKDASFLEIVKNKNYSTTKVVYSNKIVKMNIRTDVIMQNYDENHLSFLNGKKEINPNKFIQFHHLNNGDKNTIAEMYSKYLKDQDNSKVLFISDGGHWRDPHFLEENPDGKSGCRAVVMDSHEDALRVKSYLCSKEVKDFINNITFGKTYSLKASIKRILCNPENLK
jgi:hypothetical protein